jgi:hypothetical protein
MAIVVDRDAATVHPNLPRFDGLEGFFVAGESVVERQGHCIGAVFKRVDFRGAVDLRPIRLSYRNRALLVEALGYFEGELPLQRLKCLCLLKIIHGRIFGLL